MDVCKSKWISYTFKPRSNSRTYFNKFSIKKRMLKELNLLILLH